jgi:hypothetical protein
VITAAITAAIAAVLALFGIKPGPYLVVVAGVVKVLVVLVGVLLGRKVWKARAARTQAAPPDALTPPVPPPPARPQDGRDPA